MYNIRLRRVHGNIVAMGSIAYFYVCMGMYVNEGMCVRVRACVGGS
jgi:hypothetical protein